MRSSGDAGGLKELAKASMSSMNLVWGIPRGLEPSVMDSREMLAMGASSDDIISLMVDGSGWKGEICCTVCVSGQRPKINFRNCASKLEIDLCLRCGRLRFWFGRGWFERRDKARNEK